MNMNAGTKFLMTIYNLFQPKLFRWTGNSRADLTETTPKRSLFGRNLQDWEITGGGSCLAGVVCGPSPLDGRQRTAQSHMSLVFPRTNAHCVCQVAAGSLCCRARIMDYIRAYWAETACSLWGKEGELGEEIPGENHLLWEPGRWQMLLQRGPRKLSRERAPSKCEPKCDLQKWERLGTWISQVPDEKGVPLEKTNGNFSAGGWDQTN